MTIAEYVASKEAEGYVARQPAAVGSDDANWTQINLMHWQYAGSSLTTGALSVAAFGYADTDFPGLDLESTILLDIQFVFFGSTGEKSDPVFDGSLTSFSPTASFSPDPGSSAWNLGTGSEDTMAAVRDSYDTSEGFIDWTGVKSASFGFDIYATSSGFFDCTAANFYMFVKASNPAATVMPPWLAPTFTPTGNSNWARVRMNPLLRM